MVEGIPSNQMVVGSAFLEVEPMTFIRLVLISVLLLRAGHRLAVGSFLHLKGLVLTLAAQFKVKKA